MAKKSFTPKTKEQREAELNKHYEDLLKGVKEAVGDPESYLKFLSFVSKFPQRSLRNQMMIYKQKPDAQLVAGMKTWNKFGRQVNKGSEAIKIIAPITAKEKEIDQNTKKEVEKTVIKGFRLVNVFDVNDTNGVPLPTNVLIPENVNKSEFAEKTFMAVVEELRKELPITLDENYNHIGNGFYRNIEHKIVINSKPDRDITNQYKTLIHEYAHSVFHNETGKYFGYDRESKEVQAESVAYLVTKNLGMDTGDYSFPYIKGWAANKDEKLLLAFQEDIQKESAKIIKKIEDVIVERNISFDVGTVLDTNTSPIEAGEKPLSLIKYGDNYSVVMGDYKVSALNNLDSLKELGKNFDNKEQALQTFELMKGHIPLAAVEQLDKEKGKVHVFQRTVTDPSDQSEKNMYFVGVASFTNVKAISRMTADKDKALSQLGTVLEKGIGEQKKIQKDLSERDSDKDGLTDLEEMKNGTDPKNPDTNGDGFADNRNTANRTVKKGQAELELSL